MSAAPANYDASYAALGSATQGGGNKLAALTVKLHEALLNKQDLKLPGFKSEFDKKLGVSTFLWAPKSSNNAVLPKALLMSPVKPALRAESAARSYLGQQASFLRLDRAGINDAKLMSIHDTGRGPIIARFQQYKDGLEVFGRNLNVMMDRNLNAVATSGYFAPAAQTVPKSNASSSSAAPSFSLGADSAIARAFGDMGGKVSPSALSALGSAGGYTVFAAANTGTDYHIVGRPRAKQVYYYQDSKYLPAWFVEVHAETVDRANNDVFGYVVSAADGKVLFRKNLTDYDSYNYRVFADSSTPFQPEDEPIGNNTLDPFTAGPTGNQGRTQGTSNLVSLQNSGLLGNLTSTAAAKNDPWLPSGATQTSGNNVFAFANIAGTDGFDPGDVHGMTSGASTFDYSYTVDTDPTTATQRQAAIVNQFFIDNWLHDFWYDHGMDEPSGNAQLSNYGRGGVEGDPIQAQAQDNSGRNNANMSTPPDGGSPIQRMFLWDGELLGSSNVTVTNPASIGSLQFNTAAYGAHNFNVSANVVLIQDGSGNPTQGCNAATNGAALSGNIALIDRGTCSFKTKTLNAQNAGAVAVIIADNRPEAPPGLGDDSNISTAITIGTVSITQSDGGSIKTALGSGTVAATVKVQFGPDVDGTMDNQIVAHEFFHYVSNRLVGNALGLSSTQGGGMGEGWSDFDAMLLTVRPEDKLVAGNDLYQGVYPLSEYVLFNQYYGIRRYPYSTDMTVNPLTFKHIQNGVALPTSPPPFFGQNGASNAEVHNTGEVWCDTLWEVYASLLNDSRYSFLEARSRMQDYIIEGLKMTPNAPTMLEARNALLAAAKATDTTDFDHMAQAFAKRGMGVGAIGPARDDPNNLGVQESYNALVAGVEVTAVTIDFNVPPNVVGDLDGDGVLDVGETARVTATFANNGTADMAGPVTGQVTASTPSMGTVGVTLENGGAVTVPAMTVGSTSQVSMLVTLTSASDIGMPLALVLAFPDANNPQNTIPNGGTAATGGELDFYVNYDLQKTSTSDDVSDFLANLGDWKRVNAGNVGPGWQIVDATGFFVDQNTSGNAWFGPDNDHASDISLESPVVNVGTGAFSMAFDHFFNLEFAGFDGSGNAYGFDGGVIEVSTDGGATWTDAFAPSVGGQVTTGNGYGGFVLCLAPDGTFDPTDSGSSFHRGFIRANEDPNNPVLEHLVVSFGTKLAGKSVMVRFREVSDEGTGILGWVVDNIAFTGATNLPFSSTVADAGLATQVPVANAGRDRVYVVGDTVTLDGTQSTNPYGTALTYAWTQTAGPTVTLSDPTSATPTFVPTQTGLYTFSLTVTAPVGHVSSPSTVNALVNAASTSSSGGGSHNGGGSFGGLATLVLAGAAAARRRKRRLG